jgi:hypothetical protein
MVGEIMSFLKPFNVLTRIAVLSIVIYKFWGKSTKFYLTQTLNFGICRLQDAQIIKEVCLKKVGKAYEVFKKQPCSFKHCNT